MRFELKPYNRNVSAAEVCSDIQRVARELNKPAITAAQYHEHGRFSPDLARCRFGSWLNALSEAGLSRTRTMAVSVEECIIDLQAVADRLGKRAVTRVEYTEHGKYSAKPFERHFGSWFNALEAAGLERTRTYGVSNEEYFKNLEEMWVTLGRQPHYAEVQKPFSRYCAGAYEYRFGSWRKALEAFVDFVNGGAQESTIPPAAPVAESAPDARPAGTQHAPRRTMSRTISWRLRFLVMRRDDFRCRVCGRSPALSHGLTLHVDHVLPWSRGGKTVMENLQTLCAECNVGKSDASMYESHQV